MFPASLLSTLLLVLTVSANPIVVRESQVKLPLSRRLNVTSVHNLLRHDVARAKFLRARAEAKLSGTSAFDTRADVNEQVDNQAVTYIAAVGVGSPATTPVTTTPPASEFWGISQSIQYGTRTTILTENSGIVDTGTTLLLLASDAFARYLSATGAVEDNTTGLLRLTSAQFANLQSLFFLINGATFEFTANAQAWPRTLNSAIGGTTNNVYLIVGDLGTPSGEGFDFVNGFAFLERFYSVFDTTNKRVGFATTQFTTATSN
ncbi:hypothetical protein C0989_005209 [Termitomyces sp. Mn162]|nr:hypothetical protein C0989_005209 [Termitomyces sp. Mn162]